jgi:D-alanyl-lipoteichoic acid acyltransferase DltB (MBOAT superfamily)
VLFNFAVFIFAFLPVALIGCFAAARRSRAASMLWLVAASLVFYGWWNPAFLTLLGASVGANYALSRAILAAAARPRWQGWRAIWRCWSTTNTSRRSWASCGPRA